MLHFFFHRGSQIGTQNIGGDDQKKLDVISNDLFVNMLKSSYEVIRGSPFGIVEYYIRIIDIEGYWCHVAITIPTLLG